jgi:hypothetical protein
MASYFLEQSKLITGHQLVILEMVQLKHCKILMILALRNRLNNLKQKNQEYHPTCSVFS